MNELLTTTQMAEADRLTIEGGVPGEILMENAGCAVAAATLALNRGREVLVLCGPGNNGGDGFVAARHLAAAGRRVRVALLGDPSRLTGDAAEMAARWTGAVEPLSADSIGNAGVIVDALFGAGLSKPIEGAVAAVVEAVNRSHVPVVAVDVPSGVDGTSGEIRGVAVRATRTVTFFRLKPGHLLLPGRELCGELKLAQIGIEDGVLEQIAPETYANGPRLWGGRLPRPRPQSHKYDRGHALVVSGGPWNTGAARLSARAALRIGAGLVTVASPTAALPSNAAHLTAVMLTEAEGVAGLARALDDARRNAVLIGPAAGVSEETRQRVQVTLGARRPVVLDADALTCFADEPARLFKAIAADAGRAVVLTPHEGEFRRLFKDADLAEGGTRLERARAAARTSGAVIVLKGADTVVAAPDGRAAINADAPAWLATAGSGDVLSGMAAGLLAQQMPAFEAAAAAVWLHGAVACDIGPGLIAEDLSERLPAVLAEFA